MNSFCLLADESGAKGYAGVAEKFPGEAGIFAGLIVPAAAIADLTKAAKALEGRFGNGAKFHITDLQPQAQDALRTEICNIVQHFGIVCVYEAIYVSGFFVWFREQKKFLDSLPKVSRSGIKISGNTAEECLHVWLFQGLLGKAIAWCEDNYKTDYHLTVLFDNLDKQLLKVFNQSAQELLGDMSSTSKVTGFDPKTNSVVRGEIKIQAHVSADWRIDSDPKNISLDASGANQELSIFPDILSNWLNFLFKERNKSELGIPLGRRAALDGFALQNSIYGFSDGLKVQPIAETLFRCR